MSYCSGDLRVILRRLAFFCLPAPGRRISLIPSTWIERDGAMRAIEDSPTMKSLTWPCPAVASMLLVATAWAWGGSSGDDERAASAAARPQGTIQGLSEKDRTTLYHLSEGIELVPLAWLKAVKSLKTNSPFLQFPERF